MKINSVAMITFLTCVVTSAYAQTSTIRVACDGIAVGAEVSVNGEFKGECPLDVQVKSGAILVKATKNISGRKELYEEKLRLGGGVTKRIEVNFGNDVVSAPAAPVVDAKAVAMQRYEAEMDEYNRNVKACYPKYDDYVRKVKRELTAATREHLDYCVQNDKNPVNCGQWDDLSYQLLQARRTAEERVENIPSRNDWCEDQFTKPKKPQ